MSSSPVTASLTMSDETILRHLMSEKEVDLDDFQLVQDRILTYDNFLPSSHYSKEWNILVDRITSAPKSSSHEDDGLWPGDTHNPFSMKYTFSSSSSRSNLPDTIDTSSLPLDFQSHNGKAHIQALCSLFQISAIQAITWTEQVLDSHHTSAEEGNILHNQSKQSLLGTRKLLMQLRDWYWSNQIARLRIIAEALRQERCATTVNLHDNAQLINNCTQFLNKLDDIVVMNTTRSISSGDSKEFKRGIFQWLLNLATASAPPLGRNELYPLSLLSNGGSAAVQTNTLDDIYIEDYYKLVIEQHMHYHNKILRTEALETLFALLYERVEVQRVDYALTLTGFQRQAFFVKNLPYFDDPNTFTWHSDRKQTNDVVDGFSGTLILTGTADRQSHLAALILAECMCLWRTTLTTNNLVNSKDENADSSTHWLYNHPLLDGDDPNIVKSELFFLGKSILLERLPIQVMQRRKNIMEGQQKGPFVESTKPSFHADESLDESLNTPESIAILTFGLLMKLLYKHGNIIDDVSKSYPWIVDVSTKELGVECVSVANGECGAFAYLHHLMCQLFRPLYSNHVTDQILEKASVYDEGVGIYGGSSTRLDWVLYAAQDKLQEKMVYSNQEHICSQVLEYASIAREILVATLSAFQNTLLSQVPKSKESNVYMTCRIASTVYRNKTLLCELFWDNYDHFCNSRQSSFNSMESVQGIDTSDPSCQLLDVAYVLARNSVNNYKSANTGGSLWDGRKAIHHLPSLLPFISFLSSLVPTAKMIPSALKAFTEVANICYISLLGCLDLCSMNVSTELKSEEMEILRGNEDNAKELVSSLCVLVHLVEKSDHSVGVLNHLRSLFWPSQIGNHRVYGPQLLYNIATKAIGNLNLNESTRFRVSSSCLYMLGALLCHKNDDDFQWMKMTSSFLKGNEIGKGGFVKFNLGRMHDKVTSSAMILFHKMTLNLSYVAAIQGWHEIQIIQYLHVLRNGAMTACELLSSISCASLPTALQLNIASRSLSIIQNLMRSLDMIAEHHKIGSVREIADETLHKLLQTLSTSTLLGTSIGFFSTLPILLGLISAPNTNNGESLDEKYDFYDSKTISIIFDIAHDALALTLLWGDLIEKMSVANVLPLSSGRLMTIIDITESTSKDEMLAIAKEVQSHGPSRLLMSSPSVMDGSNVQKHEGLSILNLICQYISHESSSKHRPVYSKVKWLHGAMAKQAVDLTKQYIIHSNTEIKKNHRPPSNELFDPQENIAKHVGTIINGVLFRQLRKYLSEDEMDGIRFITFLQIFDLIKTCITYFPALLEFIFHDVDSSSEDLPVILCQMVNALKMKSPITLKNSLLASSCIEVLHQMYSSQVKGRLILTEPISTIISTLVNHGPLLDNCVMIVLNHKHLLEQARCISGSEKEAPSFAGCMNAYNNATILNVISQSLAILTHEFTFHLCNAKNTDLVQKINLKTLYETMISLDATKYESSKIAENKLRCINFQLKCDSMVAAAIFTSNICIDGNDMSSNLSQIFRSIHSTGYLSTKQTEMLTSSCNFIESVLVKDFLLGPLSETKCKKGIPIETDIDLITMSMDAIRSFVDNFFLSYSTSPHLCYDPLKMISTGCRLMGIFLCHIQHFRGVKRSKDGQKVKPILDLMENLQEKTSRFLIILQSQISSTAQCFQQLSCELRLNSALSALLLMKESNMPIFENGDKARYDGIRLGFCKQICDNLRFINSSKAGKPAYSFDPCLQSHEKMPLNLLRVSISLLVSIIPKKHSFVVAEGKLDGYESNLATLLRTSNALSLLHKHNKYASDAAARTYSTGDKNTTVPSSHSNCIEIALKIQNIFFYLADSRSIELATLLLENDFVVSLSKNSLLLKLFQSWSSSRNMHFFRGYIHSTEVRIPHETIDHIHMSSTKASSKSYCAMPDLAHDIWRSAIQTMVALLQCFKNKTKKEQYENCVFVALDFVQRFQAQILSCLEQFVMMSRSPSERNKGMTINLMKEALDMSSLISEMSDACYRKKLETLSIYSKLMTATFDIVKSLSTFLGAVGTAREVFSALHALNSTGRDTGGQLNHSLPTTVEKTLLLHPLLADGEYNAEHEAIKNALYANSYCHCMTLDEYSLFQSESTPSSNIHGNFDQFQLMVNNKYILLFEQIAGGTVYNSLSIIMKTHPSLSQTSFVRFSEQESTRLQLSTTLTKGTIVSIRQSGSNHLQMRERVKYANIIEGPIKNTNDLYNKTVSALTASSHEPDERLGSSKICDVHKSDLAGIEDINMRRTLFQFHSAPTSIADNESVSTQSFPSVGHLILLLRWCHQHSMIPNAFLGTLVKCIAECASLIIGNEVSLHTNENFTSQNELPKEGESKRINKQLLDLFDAEDSALDMTQSKDNSGLKSIMNDEVYEIVLRQMETSLSLAKIEQEKMRLIAEQSGTVGHLGWTRSVHQIGRRSPFKRTVSR